MDIDCKRQKTGLFKHRVFPFPTYGKGIHRGRVVSVGDLKPGVPGSIHSRGTTGMGWSALGQGTFSSLVMVCLPRGHE